MTSEPTARGETAARSRRRPRSRAGRAAGLGAATVLALVPLGYAADVALAGDTLPAGVRVGDVAVGGLTPAAAEERVRDAYATVAAAPVRLGVDDRVVPVDPATAGLALDAPASVAAASDPGLLPWRRLQARFGDLRVEPVTRVEAPLLAAVLDGVGEEVEPRVVHAAVVYDGLVPVVREPRDGRRLDAAAAAEAVRERWLRGEVVALPVVAEPARGTAEQVRAALDGPGRVAVAAPVAVTVAGAAGAAGSAGSAGSAGLDVPPEALAPALALEVGQSGGLEPRVDGAALRAALAGPLAEVERSPVDAGFAVDGESVQVVPAVTGLALPAPDLARAVEDAVLDPAPRRAVVAALVTEPDRTTAEAEALGVVERVSTSTSEHPCCQPRVRNIQRIADILDGHLVLPGEEFSLNGVVGERTRENGFVPAPQISEGRFTDGVGGGISQFTTALFNAVFFAGLEDVQHTPHSYYISRYPPGRESTVSFPEPDFRFRNDSPHAVLIDTAYTSRSVTVSFYGTKRYDVEAVAGPRRNPRPFRTVYDTSSDCTPMSGGAGFDITVTRVFLVDGAEVRRESFETTYRAQPKVVCGPEPQATPRRATPSPAPALDPPSPAPAPAPDGEGG